MLRQIRHTYQRHVRAFERCSICPGSQLLGVDGARLGFEHFDLPLDQVSLHCEPARFRRG